MLAAIGRCHPAIKELCLHDAAAATAPAVEGKHLACSWKAQTPSKSVWAPIASPFLCRSVAAGPPVSCSARPEALKL